MGSALVAVVGFFLVGGTLWALERRFGTRLSTSRSVRTTAVDLLYVVTHRVTELAAGFAAMIAIAIFALAHGWRGASFEVWLAERTYMVSRLPRWGQIVVALVLADFLGYWVHRLEHRSPLWRFHAVHHSARHLDWLAGVRLHPVSAVVSRALIAVMLVFVGVDVRVAAGVFPIVGLWGALLHANLPWRLGPLRYLIATPRFHRWHHAEDAEARDKNFAALFPLWDVLFGTFHCPAHEPHAFGAGEPLPEGFVAQLVHPFRASRRPGSGG